jgi:hypothetical protein
MLNNTYFPLLGLKLKMTCLYLTPFLSYSHTNGTLFLSTREKRHWIREKGLSILFIYLLFHGRKGHIAIHC